MEIVVLLTSTDLPIFTAIKWINKFTVLKVGLHYGDYCSKLVLFEEHKNIFYYLKRL